MNSSRYRLKVYRLQVREALTPQRTVDSVVDATEMLRPYFATMADDREHFVALALTTKNGLLGIAEVSTGTAAASLVDPKVLFRMLLVMGAARFILAHNHPSGDPTPSRDDRALTQTLIEAGKLLDLECLDHIVIGDGTGAFSSLGIERLFRSMKKPDPPGSATTGAIETPNPRA